jgi:methionyl-tRNA formyltransferase
MGVDAILESVALIKENRAPKITQDETKATYEPPCDDRVAAIDWQKQALVIYNLVRGCDPQPGAYTYLKGEKIRFYGVKLHQETTKETPGSITQIDKSGIHVATPGGVLIVSKLRGSKGGKLSGLDWAAEKEVRAGERFGD